MSDAIPAQHPAVVLRSHYLQLRALLAIAMIAVVGLTVSVVILATNDAGGKTAAVVSQPTSFGFEGGPTQGTPAAVSSAFSHSAPLANQEAGPTLGTVTSLPRSSTLATANAIAHHSRP